MLTHLRYMNIDFQAKFDSTDRRSAIYLTLFSLTLVVMTIVQDFLRAHFQNSAFYFSESFMFSSFWWLFAPILYLQYFLVKRKNKKGRVFQVYLLVISIIIHLITFPFLVWLMSSVFYYHTYSYQQIFSFTLSDNLFPLVIIYSLSVIFFQSFTFYTSLPSLATKLKDVKKENSCIISLVVSEGNNKHIIPTAEILFISANSPYVNIHLEGKRYIHNETLKSILSKLDPERFVRVHKSTIVNVQKVVSYSTRLNGDYDLTLNNKIQIRLSRNYAADFKRLFNITHPVALK